MVSTINRYSTTLSKKQKSNKRREAWIFRIPVHKPVKREILKVSSHKGFVAEIFLDYQNLSGKVTKESEKNHFFKFGPDIIVLYCLAYAEHTL